MRVCENIFREYDIRGIYPEEVNEDLAYLIGRAYGTKLRELNKVKTVVGRDNRLSSQSLEDSLIKGLVDTGINVIKLGLVTTPMCYFATNYYQVNASIMITASHNPKEYNGFKFSYNGIHNAYGDAVREIYQIILKNQFVSGKGNVKIKNIENDYIDLILGGISLGKRKIKVVYDCGNGTTAVIAKKIFSKLNVSSIALYDTSNGNFPNHHPDPCVYENLVSLRKKVLETKADFGVGYDGDGDRAGFIDEKGQMLETDKYMIIMWRELFDKVKNKACLYDIKCSRALEDELIKLGIKPIEYRTGNSYTRAASARGNYPLSGELSGHIYFRDKFLGYDDGIYASIRLIELLSKTDKPLSSLLKGVKQYYSTPEIKIAVLDDKKEEIVNKIKEYSLNKGYETLTIDGSKSKFDDGFALIRASNTGPNITMRFEATSKKRLEEIKEEFVSELKKYLKM